jgi:hypothetical protein
MRRGHELHDRTSARTKACALPAAVLVSRSFRQSTSETRPADVLTSVVSHDGRDGMARRFIVPDISMLTLGEGFEAFMNVSLSLAYLRRTDRVAFVPAVYWGIAISLPASSRLRRCSKGHRTMRSGKACSTASRRC